MVKVWVNGSFDVLHIGHIKLLEYAFSLGEVFVGIDSDKRIKQLKGTTRPFNSEQDRLDFLSSIKYISKINIFNSDEELINLIQLYQPVFV